MVLVRYIMFLPFFFGFQEKPLNDGLHYSKTVNFNLEQTASRIEAVQVGGVQELDRGVRGGFRAKIQPDSSIAAEDELRREIRCVCYFFWGGGGGWSVDICRDH